MYSMDTGRNTVQGGIVSSVVCRDVGVGWFNAMPRDITVESVNNDVCTIVSERTSTVIRERNSGTKHNNSTPKRYDIYRCSVY